MNIATFNSTAIIAFVAWILPFVVATSGDIITARRAAVEDYLISFAGCERDLDTISDVDIANVKCNYNSFPSDATYSADIYGWTGVRGDDCTSALVKPDSVGLTGNGANITLTGASTNGTFSTGVDIDRQFFDQTDGPEETIHLCIRFNLLIDLTGGSNPVTSIYFLKTFLTIRFLLDGSFELNADSKGPVGPGYDDDKFSGDDDTFELDDAIDDPRNGGGINVSENLTESETEDEFSKLYSVFAYQCALDFPHDAVDDIIYQGDLLGVCVETLFPDTFISSVLRLTLIQDDGLGSILSTSPVSFGQDNVVTSSICTIDNRIGNDNSKCFIKTSMLSMFFVSQNIVNATGEVDLLIRTDSTVGRKLDTTSRGLQSIISKYIVQTKVGEGLGASASGNGAKSGSMLNVLSFRSAFAVAFTAIIAIA